MKYQIEIPDLNLCQEGSIAEFYPIKGYTTIGFKQFHTKKLAKEAWAKQKKLSKMGFAPKVYGEICKLPICIKGIENFTTEWGFITEKAKVYGDSVMSKRLKEIQQLVESIYNKTGLKFWDCHYYNVGYIKRRNQRKLVCIDTGKESFDPDCNAWGFGFPGPKCNYCEKYQCICTDAFWSE